MQNFLVARLQKESSNPFTTDSRLSLPTYFIADTVILLQNLSFELRKENFPKVKTLKISFTENVLKRFGQIPFRLTIDQSVNDEITAISGYSLIRKFDYYRVLEECEEALPTKTPMWKLLVLS